MIKTASEKKIIDSLIPKTVDLGCGGMDFDAAVQKSLLEQIELAGEVAMQKTEKAKKAKEALFNSYCKTL